MLKMSDEMVEFMYRMSFLRFFFLRDVFMPLLEIKMVRVSMLLVPVLSTMFMIVRSR